MKNILISSFDMEIGGVERSLISMLNNFDYENYNVDLMLYSHTGDLMGLLPKEPRLLEENKKYKTFRMPILDVLKSRQIGIGLSRIISRLKSKYYNIEEKGYVQMQYMWKYALPFLPKMEKEYDVAISYLWPHYFIAEKVQAKTKIAWIHTDYSTIYTDIDTDLEMWNKFDYIVSISNEVTKSFLAKYPYLEDRIVMIENITSPKFVRDMSKEYQSEIIKDDKYFNIVSVGRICHAKGFDNAIKSLKILHNRGFSNIRWYVIGYGEDEELLRKLIKEELLEESFILLGKKINPYPYMRICDLYAQPSRYEGKAITVTEAQILGKPVMITNYTTAKSQVNNGVNGYITELSIDGIVDGIESLYMNESLRNELSNNCKNQVYANNCELKKIYEILGEKNVR